MKKLSLYFLALMGIAAVSCQKPVEEDGSSQEAEVLRMPFNERVFLLNSVGNESRIYEVDYDFQGLADSATLRRFPTSTTIPNGGHMTISPDKQWLTVVVSSESKIYLVNINNGVVRELELFNFNPDGISNYAYHYNNQRFEGKITQVDVDQDGYLFIAGKSGFYKVIADNGNGTDDPSLVNGGSDIWNDQDNSLNSKLPVAAGQVWVHAIPFTFSGGSYVETTDDGEDYFEDVTAFNPKKVKFQGGDILFTQNASETDGFEAERLISFSQWKGNTAIALDLTWDWDNQEVSFTASKLFGAKKSHKLHKNNTSNDIKGTERVTGAALTGDNYVFTSHHKRNYLNLWNLHGDHIAQVYFKVVDATNNNKFGNNKVKHFWGDMTSTQAFDKNTQNPNGSTNNEIAGNYSQYWNKTSNSNHQYAEVKLYRPGAGMDLDPQNMLQEDYNNTNDSRQHSANADIADYRKNAAKFVSLGKYGGYIMMRFPAEVTVTQNTVLQIVETSWNKNASYSSLSAAWSAYKERADVYVLTGASPRYYEAGLENLTNNPSGGTWELVGKAGIANNEFDMSAEFLGDTFQWVMIKDTYSTTPDGFDVNFVSVFDTL